MAPFFVQFFTRGPLPAASDIMKDMKRNRNRLGWNRKIKG
jgi:hypothetical protein